LVTELAHDQVSEEQSLRYAMISAVLATFTLYYGYWTGAERGWLLLMECVAVTVISLIGLTECFKKNGGSNGSHFLKRLYCLGVPVGVKVLLAALVIDQLFVITIPRIVTTTSFRDPFFVYQLATFVLMGTLTVCFYWRIAHHMRRVAHPERSVAA